MPGPGSAKNQHVSIRGNHFNRNIRELVEQAIGIVLINQNVGVMRFGAGEPGERVTGITGGYPAAAKRGGRTVDGRYPVGAATDEQKIDGGRG